MKDQVIDEVNLTSSRTLYRSTRYGYVSELSKSIPEGGYNIGSGVTFQVEYDKRLVVDSVVCKLSMDIGFNEDENLYYREEKETALGGITSERGFTVFRVVTEGMDVKVPENVESIFILYGVELQVTYKAPDGVSEADFKASMKNYAPTYSFKGEAKLKECFYEDFSLLIRDPGFNLWKKNEKDETPLWYPVNSNPKIALKEGGCAGREFEITDCTPEKYKNEETGKSVTGYRLTLKRERDSSIDRIFPNKLYPVRKGDKFVIMGIYMPDSFIKNASERLYRAAEEYYARNCETRYTYEPEVDQIYLQKHPEVANQLVEGNLIGFNDDSLGVKGTVKISSVNIKEGTGSLPVYQVTLNQDVTPSLIQKITQKVNSEVTSSWGTNGTGIIDYGQIRREIEDYGKELFLLKNKSDTTSGIINFKSGVQLVGRSLLTIQPTDDMTPEADDTVYSALRVHQDFLYKDREDTAAEKIVFAKGLVARNDTAISLQAAANPALTVRNDTDTLSPDDLLEDAEEVSVDALSFAIEEATLLSSVDGTLGELTNVAAEADSAENDSLVTMKDGTWVPETGSAYLNRIAPSAGFATLGSDGKLTASQRPALTNGSVTSDKLSSNAVTTAKLNALSVTTEKLNNSSVTTEKIANGSVTQDKLHHDLAANIFPNVFRDNNDADECLQAGVYVNVGKNVPVQSGYVDQMGSMMVTHHNTWYNHSMRGTLILVKQEISFCDRSTYTTRKYSRYVDAFVPYETTQTIFRMHNKEFSEWEMDYNRLILNLSDTPERIWEIVAAHPYAEFTGYTAGTESMHSLSVSWIQPGKRVEISWYDNMATEIVILAKVSDGSVFRSEEYIEYATI